MPHNFPHAPPFLSCPTISVMPYHTPYHKGRLLIYAAGCNLITMLVCHTLQIACLSMLYHSHLPFITWFKQDFFNAHNALIMLITPSLWTIAHHCVLLGPMYALKKTCLSCNASLFDESYASPGHNGKKSWFFTQRRGRKSQTTFFCSAISGLCPLRTNKITGDQSTGPPLVHQGLAAARAINSPQQ